MSEQRYGRVAPRDEAEPFPRELTPLPGMLSMVFSSVAGARRLARIVGPAAMRQVQTRPIPPFCHHDPGGPATLSGSTLLAVVVALLLLMAVFGILVHRLSQSAYRELEVVDSHLKALAVGEGGFSEIVARLSAVSWSKRWFKERPEFRSGVLAAGGIYNSLISDTPRPVPLIDPLRRRTLSCPNQADLLIEAVYGHSTVLMFWRLTVPEDSLDPILRVIPGFFTFVPAAAPLAPDALDPLSGRVNTFIQTREENSPAFEGQRPQLSATATAAQIGSILDFTPTRPVVDGVSPPEGGAEVPNRVRTGNPEAQRVPVVVVPSSAPSMPAPETPPFRRRVRARQGQTQGNPEPPSACSSGASASTLRLCSENHYLPRLKQVECLWKNDVQGSLTPKGLVGPAAAVADRLSEVFGSIQATDTSTPTSEQVSALDEADWIVFQASSCFSKDLLEIPCP